MNHKTIISVLAAACLMTSVSTFAQNDDHRGGHNDQAQHDNDHDNDKGRGHDDHDAQRGAGPKHDMHKGSRLSNNYRGNRYVVKDWRNRHLSAPPRGTHWVKAGDDYVLVAIASGIIADVFLNN